jgi:phosphate uptake regulator
MSRSGVDRGEVRRLQITGGSTYILSLPKKWITERGLSKRSQITLTRQGISILLTPTDLTSPEKPAEAIISIDANEELNLITRRLVSTYLVGYNTIYLKSPGIRLDLNQRNEIKNFIRRKLIGTEIIADSSNEIMIKVLLSYPELSVESALRRMRIITSSMHKDAMDALEDLNEELAREVIEMDDEVDRFNLYVIRQLKAAIDDPHILQEIGVLTRRNCLGYRLITKIVERTADHAVQIVRNISMIQKPLKSEQFQKIKAMSASAISVFNEIMGLLFKWNFRRANEIVQKAKYVAAQREEIMKFILNEAEIEEVSALSLILESVTRVSEYTSDIAEIVLNLNIEKALDEN